MSTDNIKDGDNVRLKSGGPKMTVQQVTAGGIADCVWAMDDGTFRSRSFPLVCLNKADGQPPQDNAHVAPGCEPFPIDTPEAPHV